MDSLLPQLLAFPPHPPPATPLTDAEYEKQMRSQLYLLKQVPASDLINFVSEGNGLLEILDPSINTIPYLYALLANFNSLNGKPKSTFQSKDFVNGPVWAKTLDFMERFDTAQIRYGGAEFRNLIEKLAEMAKASSTPLTAIYPIRSAILRLDPTGACFTTFHPLFARLCLEVRAFDLALPVLDKDIFHFPSSLEKDRLLGSHHESNSSFITNSSGSVDKLDYRDHLQYFLFGAMIYMGLKAWERALDFLEIVITSPAPQTVSMIQVEAYKKWVLVSLLLKGHVTSMPKTTSPSAARAYRGLCKAYTAVAEIFEEGVEKETSARRLIAETAAGQALWQEDCNAGLIAQVIDAFRRFSIIKLGKTYAALRISDVAQRTSPNPSDCSETANYVQTLIASGRINAWLERTTEDFPNWVIRFAQSSMEGPLARSEEQRYADLVSQIARTAMITERMKETSRQLGLSKEHISWLKKEQKNKEPKEAGKRNPFMNPIDDPMIEEDIMADK